MMEELNHGKSILHFKTTRGSSARIHPVYCSVARRIRNSLIPGARDNDAAPNCQVKS